MALKHLTSLDMQQNKITNLGTPTATNDVATKGYVDSVAQGLDIKASVKAASTGNVASLSGTTILDSVVLSLDDRVLLKDQSAASENGIYIVKSGAWTKAVDADGLNLTEGAFTFVEDGTVNQGRGYVYTATNTWTQFSKATEITAGTGITVSGQTVSIDPNWAGQTTITTLGTVTAGTWNASTIGVSKGGTGATTLTGYVKGDGVNALTASATIPVNDISGRKLTGTLTFASGTSVSQSIDTTGLESTLRDTAVVQLRDSSGNMCLADVTVGANAITVTVDNNSLSNLVLSYTVLV